MIQTRCRCDNAIEFDLPDHFDLDHDEQSKAALLDGSFLSVACPQCGAPVRPEIAVRVDWASKGLKAQVLPELERLSAYRGKADAPKGVELLIGYPELFERIRMLRDGLDPLAVELLKYFVYEKAQDSEPDADISVHYNGLLDESLAFHILGLKSDEAAVLKLPKDSYKRALGGLKESLGKEPFKELFQGSYRSINKLAFLQSQED